MTTLADLLDEYSTAIDALTYATKALGNYDEAGTEQLESLGIVERMATDLANLGRRIYTERARLEQRDKLASQSWMCGMCESYDTDLLMLPESGQVRTVTAICPEAHRTVTKV